jgi:hypothetical protein
VFRVTMTGIETLPASVSFVTSDGSAVAGRDYTPASGTLSLTGSSTTKAIVVPVSATSTGTFWLTLTDVSGATIERGVAAAVTGEGRRRRVRS